jgi:hypothetical protein
MHFKWLKTSKFTSFLNFWIIFWDKFSPVKKKGCWALDETMYHITKLNPPILTSGVADYVIIFLSHYTTYVATPLWPSVGVKPNTCKVGDLESFGTLDICSTARPKTPRIDVFLMSLERSWNVVIENGLGWVIWTYAAQVMGKRRVGSQIASLTPDH